MSKRTLILIAILLAVTAGLLVLAFLPTKKALEEKPEEKVIELPFAQTVLTIGVPILSSGNIYSANVNVVTGENKIDAVQLELTFDPTKITDVELQPGTFLKDPIELINSVNNETGSISYAISSAPGQESIGGGDVVVFITFRQIGSPGDETSINFEPKSLVSSQEIDKSVMKSATGVTFTLQELTQSTPSAQTTLPPIQ